MRGIFSRNPLNVAQGGQPISTPYDEVMFDPRNVEWINNGVNVVRYTAHPIRNRIGVVRSPRSIIVSLPQIRNGFFGPSNQ